MAVVLITGDVTVISHVEGAATMFDESVRAFANPVQAVLHCSFESPKLLIVDLATVSMELEHLINTLRQETSAPPRVVAFGPHVHRERLAAARQAGCDEVVSRGEFFARIESILAAS
jgi:DNA-binding NarL/FixJ family response regulator